MKNLKKWLLAAVFLGLAVLSACSQMPADGVGADAFTVDVVCKSSGFHQIFYSTYLDGETLGIGGMADLDGGEIPQDATFSLTFTRDYFEGTEDVSSFSIDFSPYGKDDISEIATTAPLSIPAEYSGHYTVVFSGSREEGFQAVLEE